MPPIIVPTRTSPVELLIFVYKAGVFTAFGHDLCLVAERAELSVTADSIDVGTPVTIALSANTGFIRVRSAMKSGIADTSALTRKDYRDIEDIIATKVLRSNRFPSITYTGAGKIGTAQTLYCDGMLSMCETSRPTQVACTFEQRQDGVAVEGRAGIAQSAFGIKPYQAMLGALKIKDEIEIVVRGFLPL